MIDRPPASSPLVPDWLVQSASLGWRLLAVVAFGLVVLAITSVLGTVVSSIVLAAAVTAAFDPFADRLRASGRSPGKVAGYVTLAALGLGLAVIAIVAIAFLPAIADTIRALNAGVTQLQNMLDVGAIPPQLTSLVTDVVNGITGWVSTAGGAAASSIAQLATISLLALFLLFFFVNDAPKAIDWTLQVVEPMQRDLIRSAASRAREKMGRSLRATSLRATVMGLITLVMAFLLGLPDPLPLGVLVFVGSFIPLLGLVAATAGVALVALGASGGPAALVVVVTLAVATIVMPRLLGPGRWVGHGVHPGIVLVALTLGGLVAGLLGLILSVPVVIVLLEVMPSVRSALDGEAGPEPESGIVPRWLEKLAQWSWRLLVLTGVAWVTIYALIQVPLIVVPLIIAAVVAATMAGGFAGLRRRGLSPTTAGLAMTIGGYGIVVFILGLTVVALAEPIQEMVDSATSGANVIDEALNSGTTVASLLGSIGPQLISASITITAALVGFTIAVVLGAILTFYLLRDGVRGWEIATARLTSWRRQELTDAAGRATGVLGGYMIATGVISLVGAASQFLVMWLLGLPLALPLAVLTFFGGYIPYIGSLLTTLLAFLVTVAEGTTQDAAIMLVYTLAFNIIQGNIVAPLVYGRAVKIHPAVVLMAIPAGSAIAGIAGMFLAVPFIGVVAATWRTVLRVFGQEPEDRVSDGAVEAVPASGEAATGADAASAVPAPGG